MKLIQVLAFVCSLIAYTTQQLPNLPNVGSNPLNQLCKGPNEIFIPCKNDCIKDTCDYIGRPIVCTNLLPCLPGCICQIGYFRKTPKAQCGSILKCFI